MQEESNGEMIAFMQIYGDVPRLPMSKEIKKDTSCFSINFSTSLSPQESDNDDRVDPLELTFSRLERLSQLDKLKCEAKPLPDTIFLDVSKWQTNCACSFCKGNRYVLNSGFKTHYLELLPFILLWNVGLTYINACIT